MNLQDRQAQETLIKAVNAGMEIVRQNQGGHLPDNPEVKNDKTLVTVIDHRVETEMTRILRQSFGEDVHVSREEGGESGKGEIVLLIDPLDGTRAFTNGMMSSTVILAAYDHSKKQVAGCVVGEAATGRLWYAFENERTRLGGRKSEVSVWPHELNDQATVFLDVSHGFTRKGRQILTDYQLACLFDELNSKVKLFMPGSNGLQQALVANGGQKVVGSITTAIGGPWDVCGVKLVLNAGGTAKAFRAVETGDMYPARYFITCDPLDVMSYDILVCGNSQETVDSLIACLPNIRTDA